jgi:hypothetical protein
MDTVTDTTATITTIPEAQREWDLRLHITRPHRHALLLWTSPGDPSPPAPCKRPGDWNQTKAFHAAVGRELGRVPEALDLGFDQHGLKIIAFEVVGDLVARDPEGRDHVVVSVAGGPQRGVKFVLGWKTLDECEQRQRRGEGAVETWRGADGLRRWVWNEAVRLVEGERCFPFDRDEDDPEEILEARDAED